MALPRDLAPRVAVAVVGGPLALGAIRVGGWTLGIVVAILAAIGAWEFFRMARLRGDMPFRLAGCAGAALLVLAATARPTPEALALGTLAVTGGLLALGLALSLVLRWPGGSPMGAVGSTLAGTLYVGLPLAFLPLLRALTGGLPPALLEGIWLPMAFVLFPLLVTWASDSAAYFVGNAVGRHKLAPTVSPGKSVEGSVGGILGGMGAAALMSSWWLADLPLLAVPVSTALWMGAVLSVGGQLGDLVESALKREVGVKDSGRIFPGHGGVLDRVDALLWAFPLTWLLLWGSGTLSP